MTFDNTYVNINLDAIAHNLTAVSRKAGVPVMAVVKANGYGHGAVTIARHLENRCAFFGVSSVSEALELRRAGIQKPILILGQISPAAFPTVIRHNIRPAIFSMEDAEALSYAAVCQGKTASFHFALDTGMSRIGFQACEEAALLCAQIAQLPGLRAEGIFSHFATADSADLSKAQAQAERFDAFLAMLESHGVQIPIRHLNNSAGVMNFKNHYDMVRSGIVTYGMYPSQEVNPADLDIRPALTWCSRVTAVKELPPGRDIGYGATYTTTAPTTVATVACGYADGYRRSLSGKFHVLIHGQKAPILGRICMDQLMVDVTDIPDVKPDDQVVLLGKQGDAQITAEELAEAAGSFNYETVCAISRRVPRYYYQSGHLTQKIHYLLGD